MHLGTAGHLVTITSKKENDFLETQFSGIFTVQKFGDSDDQDGDFAFIGLLDANVEGMYKWVTGESFSFEDWGPFEPNNLGDQDYGIVRVLQDARVSGGRHGNGTTTSHCRRPA